LPLVIPPLAGGILALSRRMLWLTLTCTIVPVALSLLAIPFGSGGAGLIRWSDWFGSISSIGIPWDPRTYLWQHPALDYTALVVLLVSIALIVLSKNEFGTPETQFTKASS
jgi:hypothetical protein